MSNRDLAEFFSAIRRCRLEDILRHPAVQSTNGAFHRICRSVCHLDSHVPAGFALEKGGHTALAFSTSRHDSVQFPMAKRLALFDFCRAFGNRCTDVKPSSCFLRLLTFSFVAENLNLPAEPPSLQPSVNRFEADSSLKQPVGDLFWRSGGIQLLLDDFSYGRGPLSMAAAVFAPSFILALCGFRLVQAVRRTTVT